MGQTEYGNMNPAAYQTGEFGASVNNIVWPKCYTMCRGHAKCVYDEWIALCHESIKYLLLRKRNIYSSNWYCHKPLCMHQTGAIKYDTWCYFILF